MADSDGSLDLKHVAWLTNIPVIGGVVDAIATFILGSKIILTHPRRWIEILNLKDRPNLNKAFKFLIAGIVVSYIASIPIFVKWEIDTPQGLYVIHSCIKMLTAFVILHFTMKLFRSKVSLRTTISLWCFSNGLFYPIYVVFFYFPLMWAAGPWVMDMDSAALADPGKMSIFQAALHEPSVKFSQSAMVIFTVIFVPLQTVWLKDIFGVSWWRTIVGVFVGILVAIVLITLTSNAVFRVLDRGLSDILKFT